VEEGSEDCTAPPFGDVSERVARSTLLAAEALIRFELMPVELQWL
jgi:hypothetical protein